MALATLGGGCFWCIEAALEQVRGVARATSGYAGGKTTAPTYRDVCGGGTGHAEVVQIEFDESELPYRDLLTMFFSIHDPTSLNRQGADVGTQYRSAIFTHSPEQQRVAQDLKAELDAQQIWPSPIVTEILPCPEFYPAEEYHQGYFRANPTQGYCQAVVSPKVAKVRKHFADRLKS